MYTPKHLKRWTMPDHYSGASWPEYYSSGVGQSRDSDALEESNFRSMLKILGGKSGDVPEGERAESYYSRGIAVYK